MPHASRKLRKPEITWFQVVLALVFLLVFGLSFAVVFEYASIAIQSVKSDIFGPASCKGISVTHVSNVSCTTSSSSAECYVVMAQTDNDTESDVVDVMLHQYYQDYYLNKHCSYTQCKDASGQATLSKMIKNVVNGTVAECWLDRNKPGRAFLQLDNAEGIGNLLLSKDKAYLVLTVPLIAMCVSLVSLVGCLIAGKVQADEVHLPIVTPNHIQIKGKWYLRSPRQSTDAGVDSGKQPEDKWQQLKKALDT